MNLATVLCFVLSVIGISDAYNILGVFPFPAYSHYALGSRIMKALAEKGHNVTVITPILEEKPPKNYRQIYVSYEATEELENFVKNMLTEPQPTSIVIKQFMLNFMGADLVRKLLGHPNVQHLLKDATEHFDVLLIEEFADASLKALSHHYNAPIVALSTLGATDWVNEIVGNPSPASYVVNLSLNFIPPMDFWQRLYNWLLRISGRISIYFHYYILHNRVVQDFFPGSPPVEELNNNVALVLLNSHVSTNQPIPKTPNMIEIGGFHVYPPKKLPEDLQKFLDDATEGVVYFSMESNLKSKHMPVEKREAILKAFSKLKHKVLWKWEDDVLPNQPDNVKLGKWLPQQDILAHPNIKLFITHGGLLSTIEAVYHGVPVLGLPIFGDQPMNMAKAVASGYAVHLDYFSLTEEKLSAALKEILNNPKYTENVKSRSKIMRDRQIHPLDEAVYWIEFVVRHKGAQHFRSASLDLAWYQYHMIDVLAFVMAVSTIIVYVLYRGIKKLVFRKRCTQEKKKLH